MNVNVGKVDQIARALIGIVLLYFVFLSDASIFESKASIIVGTIVGIVMLLTSFLKICPLYSMFGIKTCKET